MLFTVCRTQSKGASSSNSLLTALEQRMLDCLRTVVAGKETGKPGHPSLLVFTQFKFGEFGELKNTREREVIPTYMNYLCHSISEDICDPIIAIEPGPV